jgi:hypothetical protein
MVTGQPLNGVPPVELVEPPLFVISRKDKFPFKRINNILLPNSLSSLGRIHHPTGRLYTPLLYWAVKCNLKASLPPTRYVYWASPRGGPSKTTRAEAVDGTEARAHPPAPGPRAPPVDTRAGRVGPPRAGRRPTHIPAVQVGHRPRRRIDPARGGLPLPTPPTPPRRREEAAPCLASCSPPSPPRFLLRAPFAEAPARAYKAPPPSPPPARRCYPLCERDTRRDGTNGGRCCVLHAARRRRRRLPQAQIRRPRYVPREASPAASSSCRDR